MDEKKRQVWRFVIQTAISILTAIATALGVTSCMAPCSLHTNGFKQL